MKKLFRIPTTYFYTMLVVVLLSSCTNNELEHKVIRSKSHLTFTGQELPNGICRFSYKNSRFSDYIEFSDKCEKYNVGDTIVGVRRNYH